MNLKKIFAVVATVAMILLLASSALSSIVPPLDSCGLPKPDEILYKAYPGATADVIVEEFLTGVTEWIGGPGRKDLYDSVIAAGHTVSPMDPMAEFSAAAINCREFKETSLESNFPLNEAPFRMALSYIYGMDEKQADIYDYYKAPWYFALGNPIPPAQVPWYDETIEMPDTDFAVAWDILQAAGYEVDGDNHLSKDGVKLRDLDAQYTAGSLYWEQGPGLGLVTAFNEFIAYIGATDPTMSLRPVSFMTWVMDLLYYHDYDFVCFGLTNLGVYADWLYGWLHTDNDVPGGWNVVGIHDTDYDVWTEIIQTSMDEAEVISAYSDITAKFVYELMPWLPIGAGLEFCTTWKDGDRELTNIVSMLSYGPRNDWSWSALHWLGEPCGGTVKTAIGAEPTTMNPYTEDTLYGWDMIGRALGSLLNRDPTTLELMPWIASEYSIDLWTSIPELGITEGSTATFYLRQDVTWQDGQPVTAYDCVNNLRILRKYEVARYSDVWMSLVYEEADGPYKFNVYFYTTGLSQAANIAGTALLAPKHIMDLVEQQVKDGVLELFEDWTPCDLPYVDLTEEAPPAEYPFMTQLVGCGPYVFDNYDRSLATGRVAKYEDYFVSAGVLGAVVGEWRIDPDTTYPYKVLVQNALAKNSTETTSEMVSVTVDVKVYEDDVSVHNETGIVLDPYEFMYLGPYTTGALAGGEHTIKVEIYEAGTLVHTYIHKLVATIREDLTTYSGSRIDFAVNMRDIGAAAKAFGSYPGHLRWDPPSDINDDFKVDMRDIGAIAKRFGWSV